MYNPKKTYIYPTASSVAAFLDGYHVDQLYQIQYKESNNILPIYGYNDKFFSTVAQGKYIVQGVLVINFITPLYLNNILSLPTGMEYVLNTNDNISGLGDVNSVADKFNRNLKTELPPNGTLEERKARAEFLANSVGKNSLQSYVLKHKLYLQTTKTTNYKRSFESSILKNKSNLNLDVFYGESSNSIRFTNVYFTEVSQILSQAGSEGSSEPLYEVYSFLAREKQIKI
jgi:hypothetical protein